MNRKLARSLFSLTVAGALLGATGGVALADALPQAPLMDEVFALEHTPHLFFLDEQGDVPRVRPQGPGRHRRGLVRPPERHPGPAAPVHPGRAHPLPGPGQDRGRISLPQIPFGGGAPVLRLVKPADLAVIGVTGENAGRLVLEQGTWEARYGLRTGDLQTEDLSLDGVPAVGPAMPQEPTSNEVASA